MRRRSGKRALYYLCVESIVVLVVVIYNWGLITKRRDAAMLRGVTIDARLMKCITIRINTIALPFHTNPTANIKGFPHQDMTLEHVVPQSSSRATCTKISKLDLVSNFDSRNVNPYKLMT